MSVPRGTLKALRVFKLGALLFVMVATGCDTDDRCLSDLAQSPEWCVRTCEGKSFEFNLDTLFGARCGFCRCFDGMDEGAR